MYCLKRSTRAIGPLCNGAMQSSQVQQEWLLRASPCTFTQLCFLRDVDYFGGFRISKEYLGKTMRDTKQRNVLGYSNLKTYVKNRLSVVPPENLDLVRFAACTLTERSHSVKLPNEYTIEPLTKVQFAGRDPNTGRIAVHHRGGGKKKLFHWIDFNRLGPSEDEDLYEKVLWIGRGLYRSAYFALVGNGTLKRYVLAHHGMQVGDIIRSTRKIPNVLDSVKIGDAYPLGAIPVGTQICHIETLPRRGATKCRAAGASATVTAHLENNLVLIQLSERREMIVSKHCMAVVGKLMAPAVREMVGSGQRRRWMGKRPRSGWKRRKTGRFGRNLNKKKQKYIFDPEAPPQPRWSFPPLAART